MQVGEDKQLAEDLKCERRVDSRVWARVRTSLGTTQSYWGIYICERIGTVLAHLGSSQLYCVKNFSTQGTRSGYHTNKVDPLDSSLSSLKSTAYPLTMVQQQGSLKSPYIKLLW